MPSNTKASQATGPVVVSGCKVCSHPKRAEIDQMLILGLAYQNILDNLGLDVGDLNKKNLGNHKRKHLNPDQACPDLVQSATMGSLVSAHERMFDLALENQRLRAENMLADAKLRMTQQAAVCLTIIDQLPNILDQVKPSDVLKATEMLAKITGDSVERHHHEIDIVGELDLGEETIKGLGDLLANSGSIQKFFDRREISEDSTEE